MKSFVVLAANGISDYALRPLTQGGCTALASALERTSHFPDYAGTIITAAAEQCAAIQKYCDDMQLFLRRLSLLQRKLIMSLLHGLMLLF